MLQSEETVHKQIHYHYQYYGVQKTFCIGTLSLAGAATSIIFVAKTCVCHDKTFVATKTILVAALTNDRTPPWEKSTSEFFFLHVTGARMAAHVFLTTLQFIRSAFCSILLCVCS